jgi:uncharacterized membrane protein required for colicin V production
MILDIVFSLCLILGFYHGYHRGILYSAVSIFGVFIASLASMKLTHLASIYLTQWFNLPYYLLPFISMVFIFLTVFGSLKLLAYILVRFLESLELNSLNKIGGGLLWSLLSLFLWSSILWLLDKGNILKPELKFSSFSFSIVQPIAPLGFDLFSAILPIFKDWYSGLILFFEKINHH